MKFKAEIITLSLDLYYRGLSLRKICDFMHQNYGIKIAHPTILNWIRKYVSVIKAYTNRLKLTPSNFNADETVLPFRKHNYWAWDIIDRKSRFLVALHLTSHRLTLDNNIFKESLKFVNGQPKIVFTDGYYGYKRMIRENYPDAVHERGRGIADSGKLNIIEKYHDTLKDRTKTMRGFKSVRTGQTILDGWKIYYNFIRPNMNLYGKTPAEVAGLVRLKENKWLDLIQRSVRNAK
jgi:transposase-like protein